jgi:hypothetical protein
MGWWSASRIVAVATLLTAACASYPSIDGDPLASRSTDSAPTSPKSDDGDAAAAPSASTNAAPLPSHDGGGGGGADASSKPATCTGLFGDVDRDGKVTLDDGLLIDEYALGKAALDACQQYAGDVCGGAGDAPDGKVTTDDAACVVAFVVGNTGAGRAGKPM